MSNPFPPEIQQVPPPLMGVSVMTTAEEIARLEASMKRLDEADPDDVDPDEYARILARLVKLREERDAHANHP